MKTKSIAPWNLKVGQKLIQSGLNNEQRANKIISINREVGRFTGRLLWRVETDSEFFSNSVFHAKFNRLPLQKATIQID